MELNYCKKVYTWRSLKNGEVVTLAIYKRGYLVIHRLSEHSVFFFLAAETSHVETFPEIQFHSRRSWRLRSVLRRREKIQCASGRAGFPKCICNTPMIHHQQRFHAR